MELADRYTRALEKVPGLAVPHVPEYARTNFQSYAVRVLPGFPMGRDGLMQALLDRGVSTRRGIMNSHQEPAYADGGPYRLPESEAARDRAVILPLYHTMTEAEQDYVIDLLATLAGGRKAG